MKMPTPADVAGRIGPRPPIDERPHGSPYHLFARVESPQGWLTDFLRDVSQWLGKKGLPTDISEVTRVDVDNSSLLVLHHDRQHESAVRIVLHERNTTKGNWTTEIVGFDSEKSGRWLSIKVTNSQGNWVAVPGVARAASESIELVDGALPLAPDVHMITPARVPELVETLLSPDRMGVVFVAGTDDSQPFDPFHKRVGSWARDTVGLAHVAILQPAAVPLLRERLGDHLAVSAWTLRTYQPRMTLDDPSSRHRYLTASRIESATDGYIRSLLGRLAKDVGERLALPQKLVQERNKFDRLENRLLAQSLLEPPRSPALRDDSTVVVDPLDKTKKPTPAPEPTAADTAEEVETAGTDQQAETLPALEAELDRIRTILHVPDLSNSTLENLATQLESAATARKAVETVTRRLDQLQDRIEDLVLERDELREQLDDERIEHHETSSELDDLVRRRKWLEKELAALGSDSAYSPTPDSEEIDYPESFEAIFDRVDEIESMGLTITADPSAATELDAVDVLGKAAKTTWMALVALADYRRACEANDHQGGVHAYIESTPLGYIQFPPGKHARTESEATMSAYGHERMLPVPTDVDESGVAQMRAHFKLGRIGMKSPRMYYLDDLNSSGKIVVGYIGAHMTNTLTN